MKPPEEIKKGLKYCVIHGFSSCHPECPYFHDGNYCKTKMHSDTSAYITQLESDNETKQKRIEELDQMVVTASRQLSLDLGRLEYYADEKKRTDETLSYAHSEMMNLRVELHEAKSRLAQVERERDALIRDHIPQTCDTCKYSLCFSFDNPCNTCDHLYRSNAVERGDTDRWEFVGVCAENTEEDDNA